MTSDSSTSSPEQTIAESAAGRLAAVLQWGLFSALGLAVLSLACAHAPARVRLLGLFAVGYGLLAGFGMGRLARALQLKRRRLLLVLAGALIAGGACGIVLESRRVYAAELRKQLPRPRSINSEQQMTAVKLEALRQLNATILEEKTRLSAYLQWRTSRLGTWPDPWPILFWIAEVTCGSLAGVWMFHRGSQNQDTGSTRPS